MSSEALLELAKQRFRDDWSDADETLFQQTGSGEVADYGEGDPADADTWSKDRVLQADRIEWLCTDRDAVKEVTHKGVQIIGARIDGELTLFFAQIPFPLGIMNSAIRERMLLEHAHLPVLALGGTHTGPINADGLRVEHDVFMRDGFQATGEVRLVGAKIGGALDCGKGQFSNPNGKALIADRVDVKGTFFLSEEFQATGEVRLFGAKIGGTLDCSKGHFSNPNGKALIADRVDVKGTVFLNDGFHATGEVRLLSATIGSNLDCVKGHFTNPHKDALSADGIEVKGAVFLRQQFRAEGVVDFTAATVIRYFVWRDVQGTDQCTLRLESARIGTLRDEEASWPAKLYLDGLVYDRLHNDAPLSSEARLRWLRLQGYDKDRFVPQPYVQLAKVLQEMGHEQDARKILIAKQKDPARLKGLTWPAWAWHHILGATIGYGYRPWRAIWWILGFIVLGTVLFGIGSGQGLLVETKEGTAPAFNTLVYSVDAFVPLIDLHQAKYRLPTGPGLRLYLWIHISSGWLLTTLLVVGLTGLVRK